MTAKNPIFEMDSTTNSALSAVQKLKFMSNGVHNSFFTFPVSDAAKAYRWHELKNMLEIMLDYIDETDRLLKELRELADVAHAEAAADTGGK